MSVTSSARVPTQNASKYLQQLCKHWAHNLEVVFTPQSGHVVFPPNARGADWPDAATLDLADHADGLDCRLTASHPDQLAGLKDAVVRHLDRFAFREAPLSFAWSDPASDAA